MLASSDSMWKWISSTTFMSSSSSQSPELAAAAAAAENEVAKKKVPTPPLPASNSQKQLQSHHHHQRSTVVLANNNNNNSNNSNFITPPPSAVVTTDWRSQMEVIVKLSQEVEKSATAKRDDDHASESESTSSSAAATTRTSPKWCKAVIQALRLQKLQKERTNGEKDDEEVIEARNKMITRFWEVAADEGNLIAGVEFARYTLAPYMKNENDETSMKSFVAEVDESEEQRTKVSIQKALSFLDLGCVSQIPSAMDLVSKILLLRPHQNNQTSLLDSSIFKSIFPSYNPASAKKWLEKAASMDYAPAMDAIGKCMFFEHHNQDEQQKQDGNSDAITLLYAYNVVGAMRCFKKAVDLGFVESNFNLGKLFLYSLLDEDSTQQQREKISRAQYFLNQYLTLEPNSMFTNEAVQLLEKCGMKLATL